jgi:hypothetical protein
MHRNFDRLRQNEWGSASYGNEISMRIALENPIGSSSGDPDETVRLIMAPGRWRSIVL